jgi:hypothetical protein
LSHTAFERMHRDAVKLAYEAWPADDSHTWQGLSVYAIDGSIYNLPASEALRQALDPAFSNVK